MHKETHLARSRCIISSIPFISSFPRQWRRPSPLAAAHHPGDAPARFPCRRLPRAPASHHQTLAARQPGHCRGRRSPEFAPPLFLIRVPHPSSCQPPHLPCPALCLACRRWFCPAASPKKPSESWTTLVLARRLTVTSPTQQFYPSAPTSSDNPLCCRPPHTYPGAPTSSSVNPFTPTLTAWRAPANSL
jgi:hypothetical protein